MLIHIGDNISLFEEDILMFLDKKTVDLCKEKSKFIKNLIVKGDLVNKLDKNVKTYIVVIKKDKRSRRNKESNYKLYVSNISSLSLIRRKCI